MSRKQIKDFVKGLNETENVEAFVNANKELSKKLNCVYEEKCESNDLVKSITNIKYNYLDENTKEQIINDINEYIQNETSSGGRRKVKHSRNRKSHRKSGKRTKRHGRKTRRIIYGGSDVLDSFRSYSSSPLNPGMPISGVNNLSGTTHVAIDTKPSGMV